MLTSSLGPNRWWSAQSNVPLIIDAATVAVFITDNTVTLSSRCNSGLASGLSQLYVSRGSPSTHWQSVPQWVFSASASSIRQQAQPASRMSFNALEWLPLYLSFSQVQQSSFSAFLFPSTPQRRNTITTLSFLLTTVQLRVKVQEQNCTAGCVSLRTTFPTDLNISSQNLKQSTPPGHPLVDGGWFNIGCFVFYSRSPLLPV